MSRFGLLEAMRPHQWVKNLLVFAPLLFAHRIGDPEAVWAAVRAFAAFCLLASASYLFNDVLDRESDRRHPAKRERPVAAGRLTVRTALGASGALFLGGLAVALTLDKSGLPFVFWPASYVLLNVVYSFWLKRVAIVDALCIAMGFQIRVHAGSVAIGVPSSKWLLLCTFFFATFLAFCKRRDEVASIESARDGATRASLRNYSVAFLDRLLAPLGALSILAYALYTLDEETVRTHGPNLMFTVPFVVFGVIRYLWLVLERGGGAEPSRLLFRDRQLQVAGVSWLLIVLAVVLSEGHGA